MRTVTHFLEARHRQNHAGAMMERRNSWWRTMVTHHKKRDKDWHQLQREEDVETSQKT